MSVSQKVMGLNTFIVNIQEKIMVKLSHESIMGKWRYSSTHSLTSALDGVSGELHAPAALHPGKEAMVPTG
jgi:hypothetical protein